MTYADVDARFPRSDAFHRAPYHEHQVRLGYRELAMSLCARLPEGEARDLALALLVQSQGHACDALSRYGGRPGASPGESSN